MIDGLNISELLYRLIASILQQLLESSLDVQFLFSALLPCQSRVAFLFYRHRPFTEPLKRTFPIPLPHPRDSNVPLQATCPSRSTFAGINFCNRIQHLSPKTRPSIYRWKRTCVALSRGAHDRVRGK